MRKKQLTELP